MNHQATARLQTVARPVDVNIPTEATAELSTATGAFSVSLPGRLMTFVTDRAGIQERVKLSYILNDDTALHWQSHERCDIADARSVSSSGGNRRGRRVLENPPHFRRVAVREAHALDQQNREPAARRVDPGLGAERAAMAEAAGR